MKGLLKIFRGFVGMLVVVGMGCLPVVGGGGSYGWLVLAAEGAYLCTPDDRAHIQIPPGALERDTTITISEVPMPDEALELEPVGPAFDFGPDGTRFAQPVWIQLHPGPLPAGRSLSELSLFNLSGGVVEELDDVFVDEAAGTISGFTTHFSTFFAAFSGPAAGGRMIRVGGPNLAPLFGSSTQSVNPPEVALWVAPGGSVSTNPYAGPFADEVVIQIDTGNPVAGESFYIEGWTVSPVDPDGTVGPTGDRISTRGFWHDYFAAYIEQPLRDLRTDSQGRLTLVLRGADIYSRIVNAPPGYSEGRLRLRVFSPDTGSSVDIYIALTTTR
jgi:hypothetical protein